jgi:hypothetical protein
MLHEILGLLWSKHDRMRSRQSVPGMGFQKFKSGHSGVLGVIHRVVSPFFSERRTITERHDTNSNNNTKQGASAFDLSLAMNLSSPPSAAASGEFPRPSLPPISDASSTGMERRKTPSEKVEEAFGGERKLWPLRGHWWPGITRYSVAMKRLNRKTPVGLSPSDCLRFGGLKENEVTHGLFNLAENYE